MGFRDAMKKVLPLPAASTQKKLASTEKKVESQIKGVESRIDTSTKKLNSKLDSFVKRQSALEEKLNRVEEQVGLCRRTLSDNHFFLEKHDKAWGGVAKSDEVKALRQRMRNIERLAVASSAATMERSMVEHLDYHIVDHCNLNCASCSTFSPIAEEWFASTEVFERDLLRLRELIGDKLLRLHILGGEPLLHPEIESFMKTSRGIFPEARIDITTNGLLVSSRQESFWEVMRDCRIDLKFTRYPVKVDYDGLINNAAKRGIFAYSAGESEIQYFRRIPLNPKGTFNVYETYLRCPYVDCPQLKDGILYRCPASAYSNLINKVLKKEGKNCEFRLSNLDYLDLSEDITGRAVFEFLSRPIPFCQYCDMDKSDNAIPWGNSCKAADEWVDL